MASWGRKIASSGGILAVCVVAGLYITKPERLAPDALEGMIPSTENGARVFSAMGCASCHSAPLGVEYENDALGGGKRFPSPFGTFVAPNISSHPTAGIGTWTDLEIADAVLKGTSPTGEHYYPAFPYATFNKAKLQDIVDLIAHLRSLPAIDTPREAHDLGFPFNMRVSLGGWKLLFVNTDWVVTGDLTPQQEHGRYLVEAMGHCGECHTPRNVLGGSEKTLWLAGAPNPVGKGRIPNITPGEFNWSEADVVEYLTSGFTPEYDSAGGEMADVVENIAKLPSADREAIAAYLQIVPAHSSK
ncbi:c-type cytochrome [Falsihalocynthiibacter arcticus]|uniref:Diacylglycerol kinase n=1 Tax=Falsihalocynthiibacter arcticus TaxID=1579316 RepID=A0A126V366_9RHOB|nr:cytochrome c [Falsihalocynthiibacter arcticus]AML52733.1 diacylglycerol kinase [Falsihalocynthiibacter arcticus]